MLKVQSFVGNTLTTNLVTKKSLVEINRADCSICCDPFNGQKYQIIHTQVKEGSESNPHYFHLNCLGGWFKEADRKNCPVCRADLTDMSARLEILENAPCNVLKKANENLLTYQQTGEESYLNAACLAVYNVMENGSEQITQEAKLLKPFIDYEQAQRNLSTYCETGDDGALHTAWHLAYSALDHGSPLMKTKAQQLMGSMPRC
ncbi:MAG: hypothetical protein HAW66_06260 [Shewanella sp.]|nr:hypothetical protein [Shewanella sp.]